MKRLVVLSLAAAFVLGSLVPANALEVKVSGTWEIGIGWADNTNFTDAKQGGHVDPFGAAQRIRPQFEFISSDKLSALLELEIGTTVWGSNADGSGGALDADQTDVIGVRRAYVDWVPGGDLSLRMGIQGVALPSATFGSPILDTDVAGVVANYRFSDAVSLTGFWLRPFDRGWSTDGQTNGKNSHDEMDIFGLTLPIKGEGFSVTPWAMYGRAGNDSGYWEYRTDSDRDPLDPLKGTSNMWWAGAAVELNMLEPLSFNFDAMYGSTRSGDDEEAPEFSGFLLAALIEYKTGSMWGNPGLIGWYASGDDSDDYKDGEYGKYGRMPIISTDRAGFAPTAYGFAGPWAACRTACFRLPAWAHGAWVCSLTALPLWTSSATPCARPTSAAPMTRK